MALDRKKFYSNLKSVGLFKRALTSKQTATFEAVLDNWEDKPWHVDLRWLAYMFATILRECGPGFYPVEEVGKGKGKPYGKKLKHSGRPYIYPGHLYYGRGLVQLTWFENYELMQRLLGVDLLAYPEKALELNTAVRILFEGMTRGSSSFGDFTGKCLEMYFNGKTEDWIGARRIINGKDHAAEIAANGKLFLKALKEAA